MGMCLSVCLGVRLLDRDCLFAHLCLGVCLYVCVLSRLFVGCVFVSACLFMGVCYVGCVCVRWFICLLVCLFVSSLGTLPLSDADRSVDLCVCLRICLYFVVFVRVCGFVCMFG